MPIPLIIAGVTAAIGLGTSIAGMAKQASAASAEQKSIRQQAKIGLKISKESKKVEEQRKLQMTLEAMRQRREIIRNMVSARAAALSNATLAGAGLSSGLQGGLAQESAQGTRSLTDVYTNEDIGGRIFDINAKIAKLGGTLNQAQARQSVAQSEGQVGQGLFNLGLNLMGSATTFGRVGGSLFPGGATT